MENINKPDMPDRRNGDMGTYKERLEELFNAKMSFFSLTDADKEKFIDLCKTVLTHNGYTVSAPSGISGLSQEN